MWLGLSAAYAVGVGAPFGAAVVAAFTPALVMALLAVAERCPRCGLGLGQVPIPGRRGFWGLAWTLQHGARCRRCGADLKQPGAHAREERPAGM